MSENRFELMVILFIASFLAVIAFFSVGSKNLHLHEPRKVSPFFAAGIVFLTTFVFGALAVGVRELTK